MCKAIEPIHGHEATAFCCVTTCEKEALAVAAAMEKGTTHPIGSQCLFDLYQGKCVIFSLLMVYTLPLPEGRKYGELLKLGSKTSLKRAELKRARVQT
ncbi:hypothetical protein HanXRQr2_Chr04g0184461 [Helianthus annuus]|uniref:Uncharacterized protein n=1 Tax=Helianthus annuus TaxID=4232 RepID=A0A9K3NT69_HELAN|nr:hypothetical protein HanXRQr2_Chr04g0184461 [Helianthus annuus]